MIIKLEIKKTNNTIDSASYSHVDLQDKDNLDKIEQYVLSIIAENEGWGTKNLTFEGFKKDPFQYQDALDASLFANVHIVLNENNEPVGLLEYLVETLDQPVSIERMNNLKDLVENRNSWDSLIKKGIVDEALVDRFFPDFKGYIQNKRIYSEIGVVVRPDLQGKKSGVAQSLYALLSNGITFGWTSNPLVIAQWRKLSDKVLYFPLFDEQINNIEGFASLAILYADLLTYTPDKLEGLEFGALRSPYFVTSRSDFYLDLAKTLAQTGKITKLDEERIRYVLTKESVQGAIFTCN